MDEYITACPRNCYSTCSFRVRVSENKIKRILPYRLNLACPEGPCIKGLSYIERAHSAQRITHPLKKTENGEFITISMDEALDIIAEKLLLLKDKYGSHCLLWYKGSGNSGLINETGYSFWRHFGGVTTTYGNLCWPAGLEAVRATLGSVKHNVPWDLVNAKTILIWGKNPAETNIQEMSFIIRARENGARIIVVDPRRTLTADKADLLYCPRPGTDAALALAVAWVLTERGLVDKDFIAVHVKGFDEYMERSLIHPELAEKICGIPSEEIEKLALFIGSSKPVTFIAGYGLQRYSNGGQTIRAILSLAVITGNLGKEGAGFNYANLQSYIYDDPKEPQSYYPDPDADYPFRRSVSMARLGEDILKADSPPVRAIWVERGNPVLQAPCTTMTSEAFSRSEFTVVVEQFMTDTAARACIILPAKDIFEQSDIIGSYWSPYVQLKPAILPPEGEVMPESEIYYHLGKRMGMDIPEDEIPPPGNINTEKWLGKRIKGKYSITLDDLRKGPVLAPGLQMIAYDDMKFETPSGRIELLSESLEEKWKTSPLPVYNPLDHLFGDDLLPLLLISPNMGSRIHSQFGNLEIIRQNSDKPAVELSFEDAESRGISDEDIIRIFNGKGSVTSMARISSRLMPGIVVLHNGIWFGEGGGSNILTGCLETDIGYGAAFHGNMVQVEKISTT